MIRLETERLILRDYVPEDEEEYFRLKGDPETMYYLRDIRLYSREEASRDFAEVLADRSSPDRKYYFFRAELKEDGRQIGSIGYTVESVTPAGKLVHAGYFFFPAFWGRGYGTEAFARVLEFAFCEDGVYRVTTGCLQENRGSERVMQKCGMRKEGEFPDWEWHEGSMKTRLQYRLLREEFMRKREKKMFSVAIDGPAGAGKSSAAKAAAAALGFVYVDTGALYRTIGLYLLEHGADPGDPAAVESLLPEIEVGLEHTPEGQKMVLNGREVTGLIRTPEVSMAASDCSAIPAVRDFLLELQRDLARKHNVLMDGRDIGTVVLPQAQLKVFLTASPEERARRRVSQLREAGQEADYEAILEDIKQRDYQDSHRAVAPMKQAEDGVLLDNSDLSFQQTVDRLIELVRERMG